MIGSIDESETEACSMAVLRGVLSDWEAQYEYIFEILQGEFEDYSLQELSLVDNHIADE